MVSLRRLNAILMLGGFSILAIPMVMFWSKINLTWLGNIIWVGAIIINSPHFAASYILFYRRMFGGALTQTEKSRYWLTGVYIPLILLAYLAVCMKLKSPELLGLAFTMMVVTVGWHYAKQGFGMLMMDSAKTRSFFDPRSRNILLYNTYSAWLLNFLATCHFSDRIFKEYFGIPVRLLPVQLPLVLAALAIFAVTTILAIYVLVRKQRQQPIAAAGLTGYVASTYLWLPLLVHPVALLIIPAFHSLQYLYVVSVFESNRATHLANVEFGGTKISARLRLVVFAASALALGALMFDFGPYWSTEFLMLDKNISTSYFLFWVFVNIHHYFIDSVLWRKENPEAVKYLFAV
jgi:hypothetical protein